MTRHTILGGGGVPKVPPNPYVIKAINKWDDNQGMWQRSGRWLWKKECNYFSMPLHPSEGLYTIKKCAPVKTYITSETAAQFPTPLRTHVILLDGAKVLNWAISKKTWNTSYTKCHLNVSMTGSALKCVTWYMISLARISPFLWRRRGPCCYWTCTLRDTPVLCHIL